MNGAHVLLTLLIMASSSEEEMYSAETSTISASKPITCRPRSSTPKANVDDTPRQSFWSDFCGLLRRKIRRNPQEKRFIRLRNLRRKKNLRTQEDEKSHENFVAKDVKDLEYESKIFNLDGRLLTATFLPDVVIQTIKQGGLEALPCVHTYTAALMFADVTGFTALTEVYTVSGVKGIEDLSKTINEYIGSIVSCVLSAGGDVLKYAGDAFLCAWIAEGETDLPRILHAATQCAVLIQQHHGHSETSSGVVIRIKITIAAGKLKLHYFGILEEFVHYTIAGHMISEISDLQNECKAGDVLLSYLAWDYLQKNLDYKFIVQNDPRGFVKVHVQPLFGSQGGIEHQGRDDILQSCSTDDMATVNMFLMPMMRNMDSSKLLAYMTELRQVTVLFVCIHNIKEHAGFMEKGFSVVYGCLKEMEGIFNKGITFDKGFTFLALFGLPGYKRKYESCQALRCASRITRLLSSISIKSSIGVTTGTCFCGIMGHPHRQEYTVLGRKVNMAARLMLGYANIPITCDDDTYFRSQVQLGSTSFILLESKELKGLQNIGRVYEYKWDHIESAVGDLQKFLQPIIGVTEERREIRSALHGVFARSLSQRTMGLHLVIVDGEQGSGKSRVLAWTSERAAKMGFRTLSCCPKITALHENYSIIYYMLKELCNELFKNSMKTKEETLKDLVSSYYHRTLFFLNEVLNVQLPPLMTTLHLAAESVTGMKEEIYSVVLEKLCNSQPLALIVDDAQFIDGASWKFLFNFLASTNTICVVSLPFYPENKPKESLVKTVFEKSFLIVHLPPLKPLYIAAVACQQMDVVGIHKAIVNILQTHGKSNPVWCQELLQHLKYQGLINRIPIAVVPRLRLNSDFLYPKEEFLIKSANDCVYDIKPGVILTEVDVPFSMQSLILQRLNHLESRELMVLKIAAVCGNEMDIYLLHLLNPEMSHDQIAAIITKLLNLSVLECGEYHALEKTSPAKGMANCLCPLIKCCTNTKVSCCQRPVFHSILVQDTIYKSMTTEQQIKLHQKARNCLAVVGVVCSGCSKFEELYNLDMRSCICREQKLSINIQMAHHCNVLGEQEKFLLHRHEVVKAQILLQNFQEALKLSRELTAMTQSVFQTSENAKHKMLYIESIRLVVETKCLMKMSKEALVDIIHAFELLGRKLPEYYVAGKANENVKSSYSEDSGMEANCLDVASKIYFHLKNPKQAFVLADYHLEILSRGDECLDHVINAYTMQLKCCYARDSLKREEELETHAINWCNERLDDKFILIEEVRNIIACYSEILIHSFYRNDLKNTLDVGFRVYKIMKETSDLETQVQILPLFAQALLFENNSVKCLEVLSQLREVAEESQSQVGLVLYYAELAELIILQDFHTKGDRLKECKEFLMEFYHKSHFCALPDIDFYLVATMTLWCLRFGLGSEDTNPDVWLQKAEAMSEVGGSYWALSGAISLLDVQVQGMRLLFQEPVIVLKATKRNLLKKLHGLQRKLHLQYPVLIHRIEKIHLELKQIWELLRFMQY